MASLILSKQADKKPFWIEAEETSNKNTNVGIQAFLSLLRYLFYKFKKIKLNYFTFY